MSEEDTHDTKFDNHFQEMEIQHKALVSFIDVKCNQINIKIEAVEKRLTRILKGILFVLLILVAVIAKG
jgi:hypothetical protein